MARADVVLQYNQFLNEYLTAKSDLDEFEQLLKDGLITEDKLTNMREYYETIEANYQRWSYMIWLLNIPNRASKRTKKYKEDQDLIAKFSLAKSDAAAQHAENAEALKNFRSEIKLLKKQIKETKNK